MCLLSCLFADFDGGLSPNTVDFSWDFTCRDILMGKPAIGERWGLNCEEDSRRLQRFLHANHDAWEAAVKSRLGGSGICLVLMSTRVFESCARYPWRVVITCLSLFFFFSFLRAD